LFFFFFFNATERAPKQKRQFSVSVLETTGLRETAAAAALLIDFIHAQNSVQVVNGGPTQAATASTVCI
jgi:hypothetical protein